MSNKIQNIIDIFLMEKNYPSQKDLYTPALTEALSWVNENVPLDFINIEAIGSEEINTFNEQQEARETLFKFLDSAVDFRTNSATFLLESAIAFTAENFDISKRDLIDAHIFDSVQNMGIQEKYIRGLLTNEHWLTDLDLRRVLDAFGLNRSIKISPFTEPSLRATIDLVAKNHVNAQESYIIPLLLNYGGAGNSQGSHWLAATVTVDPLAHEIFYAIDDSLLLSPDQIATYRSIIENALSSQDGDFHNPFPARAGWTINSQRSTIRGHGTQKDGYSCGYRAVRQLLSNPVIRGNNSKALEFSQIDLSSELLVKAIFKLQLEDLRVPVGVFDMLSTSNQKRFDSSLHSQSIRTIDTNELNSFLDDMKKVSENETDKIKNASYKVHPKIEEVIGDFRSSDRLLTFPRGAKDDSLTAVEYERFFEQLDTCKQEMRHSNLQCVKLSYVTNQGLDGITSYFARNPCHSFEKLIISVDETVSTNKEQWLRKLQLSLVTLSKAGLQKVALLDTFNQLDLDALQGLISFAQTKALTCKIQLPEDYTISLLQKDLDRIIERNQQKRNSSFLTEEHKVTLEKRREKPIRKREKLDISHAKQVDIELQESAEAEVFIQSIPNYLQPNTEFVIQKTFDLDDLRTVDDCYNFSAFAQLRLIISREEFIKKWHVLFGNIVQKKPQHTTLSRRIYDTIGDDVIFAAPFISKISDAALEALFSNGNFPAGGIDFQHLPQGFVLVPDTQKKGNRILHYDETYQESSLLAPILVGKSSPIALMMDLVDDVVTGLSPDYLVKEMWGAFHSSATYEALNHEIFREILLDILSLDLSVQNELIECCGGAKNINWKCLKGFFQMRSQLATLYKDSGDAESILNISEVDASLHLGPDSNAKRAALIRLAAQAKMVSISEHPVFEIMRKKYSVFKTDLSDSKIKQYGLNAVVLNDLIRIYSEYGVGGVQKVFATWQKMCDFKNIDPVFIQQIIANSDPLKNIILSQDLLESCKQLNDFSQIKREWFLQLYANHVPQSDKNFVDLLKSFAAFSRTIENTWQLSFYSLDSIAKPFTPDLDMRTAMGRMISIMHACKTHDLGAQWACIAQIDLGSSAAIHAVYENVKSRRCFFVIPAMQIAPNTEELTNIPYDTVSNVTDIAPKTMNDGVVVFNGDDVSIVQKRFFRYLAYQEYRMPLSFYIQAVVQIEDMGRGSSPLARTELNILYVLLAENTTGNNYRHFIRDESSVKAHWSKILDNIKKAQFEENQSYKIVCVLKKRDFNAEIHQRIIRGLGVLPSLPSIEMMDRVVTLMTAPFIRYNTISWHNKQMLEQSLAPLEQSQDLLCQFARNYGDKIYMGMKFYNPEHYEKTDYPVLDNSEAQKVFGKQVNLFNYHMLVAWTISQCPCNGFDDFAVPLISTFSLNYKSIEPLYLLHQQVSSPIQSCLMRKVGAILSDITNNEGFCAATLEQIMTELKSKGGLFQDIQKDVESLFEKLPALKQKIKDQLATQEEKDRIAKEDLLHSAVQGTVKFCTDIDDILYEIANPKIALFLKNHALLKNALPDGYIDRLASQKATDAVKLFVEKHFKTPWLKEQIETIRVQFSILSEKEQIQILQDIATILSQCDTESEEQEVAAALTNQQLFSDGESAYKELLSAIKKSGGSSFVYYMQQAKLYDQRNNLDKLESLAQKAAYFIAEAIPSLTNRYKHLNVSDFAPLIASVISAGKPKEVVNPVAVGESYTTWQSMFERLIEHCKNPVQLEQTLRGISPVHSQMIPDLALLLKHLDQLKNPTITRTQQTQQKEEVSTPGENTNDGLTQYVSETCAVEQPVTTWWGSFLAYVRRTGAKATVIKHYKITTSYVETKDPAALNDDLVKKVLEQVRQHRDYACTYGYALTESIGIIDNLIETYPAAKAMLLPLTKNYLEYKKAGTEAIDAHIKQAYGNLKRLSDELKLLNNSDVVLSLCEHFSCGGQYTFTDLMEVLNSPDYQQCADTTKQLFFSVITALLNNKKTCKLEDMTQLIRDLNSEDRTLYRGAMREIYRKAPYPELSQFKQWVEGSQDIKDITEKYNTWSREPVKRENESLSGQEAVNGFNLKFATEQSKKITGIEYSDAALQSIVNATKIVKHVPTDELLQTIATIRKNPQEAKADPTFLVAVMAELLYRTKGMPPEGVGNDRKWGNSFEINTTQYLAVHALLQSKKPTIAGIGTGEGKSRIMMLAVAAQWALGRTVDFVTADVSLATRDYLEYQAYFKSFKAATNLITAQTPVGQYRYDGINFSDASNLSLFRNKARSQGSGEQVIHAQKEKRCLLLDEADKTLFDVIDTRYNYSAQVDKSIQDMPWIYESLVRFFQDSNNQALFHGASSDADACNRKFKDFVQENLGPEKKQEIKKLERISRTQLESWQVSAMTALKLQYGKDFTLEANVPLVTKKGPSIVSQARLISGGAASKNAKFSFGVQQCLHARLNLESVRIAGSGVTKGDLLQEELCQPQYRNRFPVDTENQIVYSSTSKALVDEYDVILGVTGTPGAWIERAEKANMNFIDIPRHRGVHRIDRPYQLAKNKDMQWQHIIEEVRVCIGNQQPILLICKDDCESKLLYDYLLAKLTPQEKQKLRRINADTSIADEAEYVEHEAGQVGAITVSTGRLGRGTDIKLHADAKTNGLHVIGTYLPRARDYMQIVGRAGRFGAKGSSRLILSEETIRENFHAGDTIPQEFYTATENYLEYMQTTMDLYVQKQRIIKDAVSDFRMNLTRLFFENFKSFATHSKSDLVIQRWQKFFDASDKKWNETWPKISEALVNKAKEQVIVLLRDYRAEVQGYWTGMLDELTIDDAETYRTLLDSLPKHVGNIKSSRRSIELLQYEISTHKVFLTPVVDKYDKAYAGRAVILKGFWENLWRNVLPSIFSLKDTPYTKARKNGNMTWSQFLLGGKLGISPKIANNKFVSHCDDTKACELVEIELQGDSTTKMFELGVAGTHTVQTKQRAHNDLEDTSSYSGSSLRLFAPGNKQNTHDDTQQGKLTKAC